MPRCFARLCPSAVSTRNAAIAPARYINPADADISVILEGFDPDGVYKVWSKALDRRSSDPEGAITSARALLETVCKLILERNGKTYSNTDDGVVPRRNGRSRTVTKPTNNPDLEEDARELPTGRE
jgi:hypothetical protein